MDMSKEQRKRGSRAGEIKRRWTDEEIGVIESTFDLPADEVGNQIGRTVKAVGMMRFQLRSGWTPGQRPNWTEDENEILMSKGAGISPKNLADLLPGRTAYAIATQRKKLGISGTKGERYSPFEPGKRTVIAKTCNSCGGLFAGKAFLSNGRGCKASKCRWCNAEYSNRTRNNSQVRDAHNRAQSISLETATRNGEPYTEADHVVLSDPDMTTLRKALILNRTYYAITGACANSGYSSKESLGDPKEDLWLIDNPNADRIEEITASLAKPELVSVGGPAWDWDD